MPYKDPIKRKEVSKQSWIKWRKENPNYSRESCRLYRNANPKYWLWAGAKRRADEKGIPFDLTKEDIPDIPEICPIALIPIMGKQDGKKGPWDHSPSLDRIDTSKGYTKNNVCVISHKGNRWKNDMMIEDVERLLKFMKENTPDNARIG